MKKELQTNGVGAQTEAAARATFLKMTRRKWGLVRVAEGGIRFTLPLLPQPKNRADAREVPSSILVMEYWNLGDLAIVVPFLKNLRRSYPEARISLLVNAGLASFLEGQGLVDEFIPVRVPWVQHHSRWRKYNPFSRDWISFARTLQSVRKRRFDWAISGRMDLRDNFLLWLSGAARRIGYGLGGGESRFERLPVDCGRGCLSTIVSPGKRNSCGCVFGRRPSRGAICGAEVGRRAIRGSGAGASRGKRCAHPVVLRSGQPVRSAPAGKMPCGQPGVPVVSGGAIAMPAFDLQRQRANARCEFAEGASGGCFWTTEARMVRPARGERPGGHTS